MSDVSSPTKTRLIGVAEVGARLGQKASKSYKDVTEGLLPPPVRLSPRYSRWPDVEIDAIQQAYIAGASQAEVKALVGRLLAQRTQSRAM